MSFGGRGVGRRVTSFTAPKSFRSRRFRRRRFRARKLRFRRRRFVRNKRLTYKNIVSTLQPWVRGTADYGQEHNVPAVTSLGVRPCVYFTCELADGAASVDTVQTIGCMVYRHIAAIFNSAWKDTVTNSFLPNATNVAAVVRTNPKCRLYVRAKQISTIRNQTNEPVVIKAYYLKARGNVPCLNQNADYINLYQYITNGFVNNTGGPDNLPSNSEFFHDCSKSPYDSFDLCSAFKIYKVKSKTIHQGGMAKFGVRTRTHMYKPMDIFYSGGSNSASSWQSTQGGQKYNWVKGTKFILFRLEASPAGWGGTQATYSKIIQMTTPTVIMETQFVYKHKFMNLIPAPHFLLENSGIEQHIVSGTPVAPAIMADDDYKAGVETEAP